MQPEILIAICVAVVIVFALLIIDGYLIKIP